MNQSLKISMVFGMEKDMNSASAIETKLEKLNIRKHLACNEEAIKELTKNEKIKHNR